MLNKILGLFAGKSSDSTPNEKDAGTASSENALKPHYEALGLKPGADLNTARRVWKKELARVHRDLYSDDPEKKQNAQEITQRLNTAYRAIQDALF